MTAVYYRIDFTDSATNSRTHFARRFFGTEPFRANWPRVLLANPLDPGSEKAVNRFFYVFSV